MHSSTPRPRHQRTAFFTRLAKVSIRHAYYNHAHGPFARGECPDCRAVPTRSTEELMMKLHLHFQSARSGFSVLYDESRKDLLERSLWRFLRRRDTTRLSFALVFENPYFVNFTALPIDTSPAGRNFYLSNVEARSAADGARVLHAGEHVDEAHLVRVVPAPWPVDVSEAVDEVHVVDVTGETVLCKPRCVPQALTRTKAPDDVTCGDAAAHEDGPEVCLDTLYLDLSALPRERYTVRKVGDGATLEELTVVQDAAHPRALGLVDLFLTDPGDPGPGVFPIRLDGGAGMEIVPVDYQIRFAARSTFWRYLVVPYEQPGSFADLRVESAASPKAAFEDPEPVELDNGASAYRFKSSRPIPLQHRSDYHLQLRGRYDPTAHDRVLVRRLPAASTEWVIPAGASDPEHSDSDIYVYV